MALVADSDIIAMVITKLPGSATYHRVLRAIGIGTWTFLWLPIVDSATRRGYTLTRWQRFAPNDAPPPEGLWAYASAALHLNGAPFGRNPNPELTF